MPIAKETVTNIAKYICMQHIHHTNVNKAEVKANIYKCIYNPLEEAPIAAKVQTIPNAQTIPSEPTTPGVSDDDDFSDGGLFEDQRSCRI